MCLLLVLPLLACLSACSLTPTLERPAAHVPARFAMAADAPTSTLPASAVGWRAMFGDPRLQRFIDLAQADNTLQLLVGNELPGNLPAALSLGG